MITKYKLDKNVLVLDIKFLYDVGFRETNQNDIYKYVNLIFETKKIKFHGKKILIIVDGILYYVNNGKFNSYDYDNKVGDVISVNVTG